MCRNTEERVAELRSTLGAVLKSGCLGAALAAQLAGRLNFARSQTFGRCGAVASSIILRRSRQPGAMRITPEIRWAIAWWMQFLSSSRPRTVSVEAGSPLLLIWTDGAFEQESAAPASCGAVMLDPLDDAFECFGLPIDDRLCEAWRAGGTRTQLIGQAELFPTILAQVGGLLPSVTSAGLEWFLLVCGWPHVTVSRFRCSLLAPPPLLHSVSGSGRLHGRFVPVYLSPGPLQAQRRWGGMW